MLFVALRNGDVAFGLTGLNPDDSIGEKFWGAGGTNELAGGALDTGDLVTWACGSVVCLEGAFRADRKWGIRDADNSGF